MLPGGDDQEQDHRARRPVEAQKSLPHSTREREERHSDNEQLRLGRWRQPGPIVTYLVHESEGESLLYFHILKLMCVHDIYLLFGLNIIYTLPVRLGVLGFWGFGVFLPSINIKKLCLVNFIKISI